MCVPRPSDRRTYRWTDGEVNKWKWRVRVDMSIHICMYIYGGYSMCVENRYNVNLPFASVLIFLEISLVKKMFFYSAILKVSHSWPSKKWQIWQEKCTRMFIRSFDCLPFYRDFKFVSSIVEELPLHIHTWRKKWTITCSDVCVAR